MSSFFGASRVSIPNNVRKTIHDIREITGKQHGDDEIYAVLRECSMDPNETAQKLLYLDTFHEVKRKRDRKKENFNGKSGEERPTIGMQRRGPRGGGQGHYGSNLSSDAGGGKNYPRRENGAPPFLHRARNNSGSRVARNSTALPNGSANLSNGNAADGLVLTDESKSGSPSNEPVVGVITSSALDSRDIEKEKSIPVSLPVSDVLSSADSLSALSLAGHSDDSTITVETEVGNRQLAVEHNGLLDVNVGLDKSDSDENFAQKEKAQKVADIAAEAGSQSTSESNVSIGQHVTFPTHFQVPEVLKTGLTFGSFDVAFGSKVESVVVSTENGDAAETCKEGVETSNEAFPRNQNVTAMVKSSVLDNSQLAKVQPSKGELPKQEIQFLPEASKSQSTINVPNYNIGFIPTMVGNQNVPYDGVDIQAHDSRAPLFANGNSFVPPSTNTSPALPSSIPLPPQSVPVFRQAYPPNFFPYGHYISPFYMPPPMHHYLPHNGTGSVYLPPAPPAGLKYTLPHFKPGNVVASPAHLGIQPAGPFITAPMGYVQPVTSGSSMSNDELMAAHIKETQAYSTGQMTEGSGVWVHATGQEMHMNPLYNIPHQTHFAFSPQQNTPFSGMFPAMAAPATLVQPSQAAAGAIEAIGTPPGTAYQPQPQHAQINWNTAF